MKAGAADFLLKPFSLEHLMTVLRKALDLRALQDENLKLREELGHRYEFDNIVGHSRPMQEIFSTVERVRAHPRHRFAWPARAALARISSPAPSITIPPATPLRQDQLHAIPRT